MSLGKCPCAARYRLACAFLCGHSNPRCVLRASSLCTALSGTPAASGAPYSQDNAQSRWCKCVFVWRVVEWGGAVVQVQQRMAQMQEAMQRPEVQQQVAEAQAAMANPEIQARMAELKDDPEFKDMFKEIETGGMPALMKYFNDPQVLSKLGAKLEGVDISKVPAPNAAPEINDLFDAARHALLTPCKCVATS